MRNRWIGEEGIGVKIVCNFLTEIKHNELKYRSLLLIINYFFYSLAIMSKHIQPNNQSHFSISHFFQENPHSIEQQKFLNLLSDEFNHSKPFTNLKDLQRLFMEVEMFKFESQKKGVSSLVCALEGQEFIQDMLEVEGKTFTGQRKEKLSVLQVILGNFTFNDIENPVSNIKENLLQIFSHEKTVEETVFNYQNDERSNQLLYHTFINQENEKRKDSIKKLNIRKIEKSGIVSLKESEISHKVGKKERYFYCYLYPRAPMENINNFWLICVQANEKAKKCEMKTEESFESEKYIPKIGEIRTSVEEPEEPIKNDEETLIPESDNSLIKEEEPTSPRSNLPRPVSIKTEIAEMRKSKFEKYLDIEYFIWVAVIALIYYYSR